MRRTAHSLRATAFHEAGHAFVAWQLGVGLKKVTIVPSKEAVGSCHYANLLRGIHVEYDGSDRARLRMEKRIMIALAGPIAQHLYRPRGFRRYHAKTDFQVASDMALRVNGSAEQTDAYLKWLSIAPWRHETQFHRP